MATSFPLTHDHFETAHDLVCHCIFTFSNPGTIFWWCRLAIVASSALASLVIPNTVTIQTLNLQGSNRFSSEEAWIGTRHTYTAVRARIRIGSQAILCTSIAERVSALLH